MIRVRSLFYGAVLLLLAAAALLSILVVPPLPSFAEAVVVEFEPGTSSYAMAAELESQGVIPSQWFFLGLRVVRPWATLQAGEYRFEQPLSVWEAFDRISSGRVLYHPLTIPEGFNRFEVAEAVAETGLVERDRFLELTENPDLVGTDFPDAANLEGFLFPDTYYLARSATVEDVIEMMTARFRAVYEEVTVEASSPMQPYDLVKMASLIEKETSLRREHRLVSSVFYNRLSRKMLLQCDPTVIYGLMLDNRYDGRLLLRHLTDPHSYNTYVHAGLPPGPIANPGRAALKAAVSPADSDFLYFVAQATGRGGHVFSKTLAAHNRAVGEYRRSRSR